MEKAVSEVSLLAERVLQYRMLLYWCCISDFSGSLLCTFEDKALLVSRWWGSLVSWKEYQQLCHGKNFSISGEKIHCWHDVHQNWKGTWALGKLPLVTKWEKQILGSFLKKVSPSSRPCLHTLTWCYLAKQCRSSATKQNVKRVVWILRENKLLKCYWRWPHTCLSSFILLA